MILSDSEIAELAVKDRMISPFAPTLVTRDKDESVVSYGLSSYGYDVRLAGEFVLYSMLQPEEILDPKKLVREKSTAQRFQVTRGFVIHPGQMALGRTIEEINMPKDCVGLVASKSTYARLGLSVNFTVLEPGWRGEVTLELSNTGTRPLLVYVGEGIAQILFFRGKPCDISYADRQGKYQDQRGVTLPR